MLWHDETGFGLERQARLEPECRACRDQAWLRAFGEVGYGMAGAVRLVPICKDMARFGSTR